MMNQEDLKILQDYLAINDKPQKSDLIFIFGGIRMSKVWDKAIELYSSGYAKKILVSGGFGFMTAKLGFKLSEAEIIKDYLIQKGIPGYSIITEVKATNTVENVLLGMAEVSKQGIEPIQIIIISKPFHMRRCLATFNKYFPGIKILCCPPTGHIKDLMDRPEEEYCQRVLSEIVRLKRYAAKGDITTQDIPEEVIKIVDLNI